MTVTVKLAAETARRLNDKAAEMGTTLEEYLGRLAEDDLRDKTAASVSGPEISDEEFDRLLDDLAAGDKLPRIGDLSRADIYADHD